MSSMLAAVVLTAAVVFAVPTAVQAAATCGATNIALNRPATASSTENGSLLPAKAFDGNPATRWSSAFSDPQWLQVDLGAAQQLCRVALRWEAASARTFTLQGSATGAAGSWFDLVPAATGAGGVQTLDVTATTPARHVRLTGLTRNTRYGYSLFELEVYPKPAPPTTSSDWPMAGGGPGHAGVNAGERSLTTTNVDTLRQLRVTSVDMDLPAVVGGIAYGPSRLTSQLSAVDLATGVVRWSTPQTLEPGDRYSSGATVGGGLVFIGNQIGQIRAFDTATGVQRWSAKLEFGGSVFGAPVLVGDTLFVKGDAPGDDTEVFAVTAATGAVRWSTKLTGYAITAPAVDGNRVYINGGASGLLSALDATTGAVLWSVPASQPRFSPIAAGGRVYLGAANLVAYDGATGQVLWRRLAALQQPAVLDGMLYCVELSTPPTLHAMDPATGADRWTYTAQPGTTVVSPFETTYPAVANGVVYVNLGRLLAIDGVSKRLLWTGPEGITASPVVAGGYVLARLPAGLGIHGL